MDLNQKIAARREELARLERQARADEAAARAATEAEEARQREAAAEALVEEINAGHEREARRRGEEVELLHVPDPAFLSPDLKQKARERLFRREARRLWTPTDQWVVISLVAGGVCLIHIAGLGLLLVVGGLIRRGVLNRRYRRQLREDFPDLFGSLPDP